MAEAAFSVTSWGGGVTSRRAALSLSLLALAASARGIPSRLSSGGVLAFSAAPIHHVPAHRRSVACSGQREESFAAGIDELSGFEPRTKPSIQTFVDDSREKGGLSSKQFLRNFQDANSARVARGEEDIGETRDKRALLRDSLVAQVGDLDHEMADPSNNRNMHWNMTPHEAQLLPAR